MNTCYSLVVTFRLRQPNCSPRRFSISSSRTSNPQHLTSVFSIPCALFCTTQTLNPFLFNRFRTLCQKPPGVGVPQRSNRSSTAVVERRSRPGRDDPPIRPIAAKRLWCNNPQRHEKSSRSGETTPLPPVSKNKRADIGNSLILVSFASRAWVQRSKVGPQQGGPQHRIR